MLLAHKSAVYAENLLPAFDLLRTARQSPAAWSEQDGRAFLAIPWKKGQLVISIGAVAGRKQTAMAMATARAHAGTANFLSLN